MRIFVSGLGINLKTTALNQLSKDGVSVYKSITGDYLNFIYKFRWRTMDCIPLMLTNLYSIRAFSNGVFDRSPLDQLCICQWKNEGLSLSKMDNDPFTKDQIELYLDEYKKLLGDTSDVIHLLSSMESDVILKKVIEAPEFWDSNRYYVYDSVSKYHECREYFNSFYCDAMRYLDLPLIVIRQTEDNFEDATKTVYNQIKYFLC